MKRKANSRNGEDIKTNAGRKAKKQITSKGGKEIASKGGKEITTNGAKKVTSKGGKGDEIPHVDDRLESTISKDEWREYISRVFDVKINDEFFDFAEFCRSLNSSKTSEALLDATGLLLAGPLAALAERDMKSKLEERFFYDIPEVITVMKTSEAVKKREDCPHDFHLVLYRDEPSQEPLGVLSNSPSVNSKFSYYGENLFGSLLHFLKLHPLSSKKNTCGSLEKQIQSFCSSHDIQPISGVGVKWKTRMKTAVANDFGGLGVVVPYNKKTQLGFRNLPYTDKELRNVLNKYKSTPKEKRDSKPLDELITLVNIATDEGDFGTALLLGRNFFFSDQPGEMTFSKAAKMFLSNAYELLERKSFAATLASHMERRLM